MQFICLFQKPSKFTFIFLRYLIKTVTNSKFTKNTYKSLSYGQDLDLKALVYFLCLT